MELPEGPAVELRHMQHRSSNAKFREDIGQAEENTSDRAYADVGLREQTRDRNRRSPGKKLGGPFGSSGPGKPTGEPDIQIASIFEFIRSHRRRETSAAMVLASRL